MATDNHGGTGHVYALQNFYDQEHGEGEPLTLTVMPRLRAAPLTPWLATLGLTPLFAAVLVGAAQNVFSKSAKYSLFDPCKEMAYIPLDQETQLKARTPRSP